MKTFQNLSLKLKITAIIMITSCVALLLAGAAFLTYELFTFRSNLVLELSTLGEITGKNCRVAISFNQPDDADKILANLSGESQVVAACIYKDGKIWARYSRGPKDNEFPATISTEAHHFGHHSLALFQSIHDPEKRQIGTIYLRASLDQIYARLRQYLWIVASVLAVALIVALAL